MRITALLAQLVVAVASGGAFLSPRYNPPAEAIALDGLERAVGAIERAVADGADRTARAGDDDGGAARAA